MSSRPTCDYCGEHYCHSGCMDNCLGARAAKQRDLEAYLKLIGESDA